MRNDASHASCVSATALPAQHSSATNTKGMVSTHAELFAARCSASAARSLLFASECLLRVSDVCQRERGFQLQRMAHGGHPIRHACNTSHTTDHPVVLCGPSTGITWSLLMSPDNL